MCWDVISTKSAISLLKCYYCESPIEKHNKSAIEDCINLIGINVLGIPDLPHGYCYNCNESFKTHDKPKRNDCLVQLCKTSQKETGLALDDLDLTRHPQHIVDSCKMDNGIKGNWWKNP